MSAFVGQPILAAAGFQPAFFVRGCTPVALQKLSTPALIPKHSWGRLAGVPSGSGRLVIGPSRSAPPPRVKDAPAFWSSPEKNRRQDRRRYRERFPTLETLPKGSFARVKSPSPAQPSADPRNPLPKISPSNGRLTVPSPNAKIAPAAARREPAESRLQPGLAAPQP
jgi:hypothetical protein